MLIDTHCHCYLDDMQSTKYEWLRLCQENKVSKIIMPNINFDTIGIMNRMHDSDSSMFYQMIGIHPCDIKSNYREELDKVFDVFNNNTDKYVAIGEIGLDYHWDIEYKSEQIKAFEYQINIAIDNDLPISVHSRKSNQDTIPLIQKYSKKGLRGVMHCFSGSEVEAERIIEAGFSLGIGGVVTYNNSSLKSVLKNVPIEYIVVETDSPYLSPVPNRGKQNNSSNLKYIVEAISSIYQLPYEEVCKLTSDNAMKIYKLK